MEKQIEWRDEDETKRIWMALEGNSDWDVDENELVRSLSLLNPIRRPRLVNSFRRIAGKKLSTAFKNCLAGDFEITCQIIIEDPKVHLVKTLRRTIMEFPTPRVDLIIALLCERTTSDIKAILQAYFTKFGRSFEDDCAEFLQPETLKVVDLLTELKRQNDEALGPLRAHLDAEELITLGPATQYGNLTGPVLDDFLRLRSYSHLRIVFQQLCRSTRCSHVRKMVPANVPFERRNRLVALIDAITCPELFIAKTLHKSFSEPSRVFIEDVLAVKLTRNSDFFRTVQMHYSNNYGLSIRDEIRMKTSGPTQPLILNSLKAS